ncbi:MAG TPA: DUF2298 domain-containing protein [Bacillota bacterium]|nr:DUF2298 domain-containing protein [Bacillota bacterium]
MKKMQLSNESKTGSVRPTKDVEKAARVSHQKRSILDYITYFLPVIPVIVAALSSFLLKDDSFSFFSWWLMLFAFGVAAFPIVAYYFRGFSGTGYIFGKSLGVLLSGFVLWTLAYIGIVPFSRGATIGCFIALALLSWGIPATRKAALTSIAKPSTRAHIAVEETIFVLVLLFLCFFKGFYPNINGEEKYMNFAFLNSMLRTDSLPALDPWLQGEYINYYYFGQYIFAFLSKLLGTAPGVAYTLSMCTAIAVPFSTAAGLGLLFSEGLSMKYNKIPKWMQAVCGALTGLCVIFFGNSHSFFYDEKSFGNSFLNLFKRFGVDVGRVDQFFYPDSTRFIGHNPDSMVIDQITGEVLQSGDYTIHEFPWYSYLVGDLHAHVVSMMVVLLIIAFLFVMVFRVKSPLGSEREIGKYAIPDNPHSIGKWLVSELFTLLKPEILMVGVLLGIATMCNYWDFLIYFIFSAMALLVFNTMRSRHFATIPSAIAFVFDIGLILMAYLFYSENVPVHLLMQLAVLFIAFVSTALFPSALSRTGLGMSLLFFLSNLASFLFNNNFDMISNEISTPTNHTSLFQFFIVWFVHVLIPLALIILVVLTKNRKLNGETAKRKLAREASENEDVTAYTNPISRWFAKKTIVDIFMCGAACVAYIILLAPEFMYVRDIYGDSYQRANTMFKFGFAAFILLSIVMAYTVVRFMYHVSKKGEYSMAGLIGGIIMILFIVLVPGHYTMLALEQRSGDLVSENYVGLDGTQYLETYDSSLISKGSGDLLPYLDAINWLNENVEGTANICEAHGLSYTDSCIVSAYTGLPTIVGWQTHEWLWRFHGIVDENDNFVADPEQDVWETYLNPRYTDLAYIYTINDPDAVRTILAKYDIDYIIAGDLELQAYGSINFSNLSQVGDIVFTSDSLVIYQVRPLTNQGV